jgi:hypothetical protein
MLGLSVRAAVLLIGCALAEASSVNAAEGPVAAGPIGGTDIRSAVLPPPGVYGGVIGESSVVHEVNDGAGHSAPGLDAVDLNAKVIAPFFVWTPNVTLFGGSLGLVGVFPTGQESGQLVSFIPKRFVSGFGDPYVELDWSRSFGKVRALRDPGAFPVVEGLVVAAGLGAVVPIGQYDPQLQRSNGISLGNNTFDLAPSLAVTYTTPPLLFEGTEFSAKLYWNQYWENPQTHYKSSPLIDLDFAITEHIGRFQGGFTGVFFRQVSEDMQNGVAVLPDGRRAEYLALGGVLNTDIAEWGAAIKIKALTTVLAKNAGESKVIVIGFAKKFY